MYVTVGYVNILQFDYLRFLIKIFLTKVMRIKKNIITLTKKR